MRMKAYDNETFPIRLYLSSDDGSGSQKLFRKAATNFLFYGDETGTFNECNGDELIEELDTGHSYAVTLKVKDKRDNVQGIYVHFMYGEFDIPMYAHEAVHVTDYACAFSGIPGGTFETTEVRAYLLQWVMTCMLNYRKTEIDKWTQCTTS